MQVAAIAVMLFAACGDDGGSDSTNAPGQGGQSGDVMFGDPGASTGGVSHSGSMQEPTSSDDAAVSSGGSLAGEPGQSEPDAGADPSASGDASTPASGGAGGANGGPNGTQPLGALCVNNQQCSQQQGAATCCVADGCTAPCECALVTDCPQGTFYLQCDDTQDCGQYGGGKICCETGSGANVMRYCTKQNGCAGTVLP
jgi:hypothetical protein